MTEEVTLSFLLAWVLIVPLAICNALLREKIYKKYLNELKAHQLSSLVFIGIVIVYTDIFLVLTGIRLDNLSYLLYGLMWLVLTIVFEFGFGHYVMKNSWEKLLHDYNIKQGRLWSLVLVAISLAPLTAGILVSYIT